jgi:hypothetical protein
LGEWVISLCSWRRGRSQKRRKRRKKTNRQGERRTVDNGDDGRDQKVRGRDGGRRGWYTRGARSARRRTLRKGRLSLLPGESEKEDTL